jgi:hypothetical protein
MGRNDGYNKKTMHRRAFCSKPTLADPTFQAGPKVSQNASLSKVEP